MVKLMMVHDFDEIELVLTTREYERFQNISNVKFISHTSLNVTQNW